MNFRRYSFYTLALFLVVVFLLRILKVSPYILIFTYTFFPLTIVVFLFLDKYFNGKQR